MIKLKEFEDYETFVSELKYEPLKVTACLSSAFVTTDYIFSDSLISSAVWQDVQQEKAFNIQENKNDVYDIPLPIKLNGEIEKYYSSSIGFPKMAVEGISHWRKVTEIESKKKIRIGAGEFKRYDMPMPYTSCEEIVFYCNGNKQEVERLLKSYIFSIGKKRGQGYGSIRSWKVEGSKTDYSTIHEGVPMRPIPINEAKELKLKCDIQMFYSYRSPYWHHKNMTMCYIPLCKTN